MSPLANKPTADALTEWQAVFDTVPDWVSLHDRQFRILGVNRALAEGLNTSPDDLVGRYCYEAIGGKSLVCRGCPQLPALLSGHKEQNSVYLPRMDAHLEVSAEPVLASARPVLRLASQELISLPVLPRE